MQAKFVDKLSKNRIAPKPANARALMHITPDMYMQPGQTSILNTPVAEDEVEAVAQAQAMAKAKAQAKRPPPEPRGPPPTPSEGSGREQRVQQRRDQSQSFQGGYESRSRWRDDHYRKRY